MYNVMYMSKYGVTAMAHDSERKRGPSVWVETLGKASNSYNENSQFQLRHKLRKHVDIIGASVSEPPPLCTHRPAVSR